MLVICFADLFQFGPIGDSPLYIAKPRIFLDMTFHELNSQKRASRCAAQMRVVSEMRKNVTHPVTREIVRTYKTLSEADLRGNFKFAPIVVPVNSLRCVISNFVALRFARQGNDPLKWKVCLQWRCNIPSAPNLTQNMKELMARKCPHLVQRFVPGALMTLTKNINVGRGIANGTVGALGEVIFYDVALANTVRQVICAHAIDSVPEIPLPDAVTMVRSGEDVDGNPIPAQFSVIPLTQETRSVKDKKSRSTLYTYREIPFALRYAVTFEKTQGLTIPFLSVYAGPAGQLTQPGLYVAMTRVTSRECLRWFAVDESRVVSLKGNAPLHAFFDEYLGKKNAAKKAAAKKRGREP